MRLAVVTLIFLTLIGASCARDRDLLADEAEPLTCEVLQDPTNCWAATAAEVRACLPTDATTGRLSSDRSACLFADGSEVRFETALPVTADELTRLSFRLLDPRGAVCATVTDTFANRIVVEAETTAVAELESADRFVLTCGAKRFETSFDALFDCPAGIQPTDSYGLEADEVTFRLWSVTTPGPLFTCTR